MYPVIFGLEGQKLSANERGFIKEANPAGIILFSRNVKNPDQVFGLISDVRDALGRDLLVLIDQEGGRVQRLGPPQWRAYPPMGFFGKAYEKDPEAAARALSLNLALVAHDLKALGINMNALPLLDVPVDGADSIIGDRAFSWEVEIVTALGKTAAEALSQNGILPITKHIPGHGRALLDSHKKLPRVDTSLEVLETTDFAPFRALNKEPFAMTAHVVFSAVDPDAPATLSKEVISKIIRGTIGFEGLLISDDINMKALSGSPKELAEKCLAAGIDLVLHCNGNLKEMQGVMQGVKKLAPETRAAVLEPISALPKDAPGDAGVIFLEFQDLKEKLERLDR